MAAYLIDYENVKSEGIRGILQLSENDTVVIFYSHNADTLTFETMDMIFNSKATVRKYKIVRGGKNALDFQLSSYLGYLIHEGKDSCFYIISKDNGFQHLVEFWKRTFNYDGYVYCFPTIADACARQRRFDNVSAKERAKAIEEDMLAIQNLPQENAPETDSTAAASEEVPAEKFADMPAPITESAEIEAESADTDTEETESDLQSDENTDLPNEEAIPAEPETLITVTSHEDNFIVETIHEDNAVIMSEPEEPEPKPMQIPVFSESLAEKIAAAVPDSKLKITVVENNVTVHQVTDEAEVQTPEANASALIAEEINLPKITPEPAVREEMQQKQETVSPALKNPQENASDSEQELPPEEQKPTAKKTAAPSGRKKTQKPTPRKKAVSQAPQAAEPAVKEETAVKEAAALNETEPAAENTAAAKPAESNAESTSDDSEKAAPRKTVHRPVRRKKTAAAEPEAAPAAVQAPEAEPEHKQHRARTASQRGRRPKVVKSEAAAFAD